MDKATLTMIGNLQKNSGKSLQEWIALVHGQQLARHGEIVKFLKEEHGFTHGFANLVAHKALESDAGSAAGQGELLEKQYKGKEHFLPLYERLVAVIKTFGEDIEWAPKNAYVSVRRKKQFATLNPATKTRYEVGINLKGQSPQGKLLPEKPNAMCSHRLELSGEADLDDEVKGWLKAAYDQAG